MNYLIEVRRGLAVVGRYRSTGATFAEAQADARGIERGAGEYVLISSSGGGYGR